jgi:hypothetical protein
VSELYEVLGMRVLLAVSLPIVLSCAAAPSSPARAGATSPPLAAGPPAPSAPKTAASEPPERAMADADGIRRDQLPVPARYERFATDRQVAALERAIVLYEQFLERAGEDPRYGEAARRSRDRIVDARETIVFLKAQASER